MPMYEMIYHSTNVHCIGTSLSVTWLWRMNPSRMW